MFLSPKVGVQNSSVSITCPSSKFVSDKCVSLRKLHSPIECAPRSRAARWNMLNDDQYTRRLYLKNYTSRTKRLYLKTVNLVLTTTCYTFNFQFYRQTDGVTMGEPACQSQQKSISRLMNVQQYLRHYTLQKIVNDLLMTFIPFLNVCNWKTFSITSTTFIRKLSLHIEDGSNEELAFIDTYSNGIMERSLYWYIGSLHTLTNTYTTDLPSCLAFSSLMQIVIFLESVKNAINSIFWVGIKNLCLSCIVNPSMVSMSTVSFTFLVHCCSVSACR